MLMPMPAVESYVSYYDCEGERLSTLRVGRMPEAKKATLKEMLSAEVNAALEQRPDLRLVKLADAAQADSSTELIDFFHAAEQLKAATDAAYGENDDYRTVAGAAEARPSPDLLDTLYMMQRRQV